MSTTTIRTEPAAARDEAGHPLVDDVRRFTSKVIIGQEEVVERVLIALFTGGHLLLQGVPGLAKTLLVSAMARAINLQFGRVQFTIDLLPADIVGSEIFDQASATFHVNRGPIFTNILLADEINRASPKVQSALLEAMQERRVTIGRTTFRLPAPFLTSPRRTRSSRRARSSCPRPSWTASCSAIACIIPQREQESRILQQSLGLGLAEHEGGAVPESAFDLIPDEPVADVAESGRSDGPGAEGLCQPGFHRPLRRARAADAQNRHIDLGCSPRAGIALVTAARARAFIHGRDHVIPDDLFALAEDVHAAPHAAELRSPGRRA